MHRLLEVLAKLDGTEKMLSICQERINRVTVQRMDERTNAIGSEIRLRRILTHLRNKNQLHHLNDMDGFDMDGLET